MIFNRIYLIFIIAICADAAVKNDTIDQICGLPYSSVGLIYNGVKVERGSFPW